MSALKLEELYRMLTLSAVEDEVFMDCWQRKPNPEVGTDEINWISNILMNEPMFSLYSKEQKQVLFEKTLKTYNQISFIDQRGRSLNPNVALFLCLDLASAIKDTDSYLSSKLSSVVIYSNKQVRKVDNEGGLLFSRGTQIFIDFLHYSIHLIKYYDEAFSLSFENPLKDMLPKVTIDNINETPSEDLKHFKKYIKNGKERLKQIKDKRVKIDKLLSWTKKLEENPDLNKTTKLQLLSLISSLNSDISQEEIKHPKSLFISEEDILKFESQSSNRGIIKAFANIPFNGLTREIVECINTCKYNAEYSIHLSLHKYLEDIGSKNNNVFIHEISHLIDQELKETELNTFDWKAELEKGISSKNFSLGNYALKDVKEFFAVAVENFIQEPEHFKMDFPNLFTRLKILINDKPTSRSPISEISIELAKKHSQSS